MKKRLIVLVLAILALLMIVPLLDSAVDSVRDAASQAQPDPTPAPSPHAGADADCFHGALFRHGR